MRERRWRPEGPVDVGLVLSDFRRGSGDPACRVTVDGAVWRTSPTPEGAVTLRVSVSAAEGVVVGNAWGEGAGWMLDRLPALLGADDDISGFEAIIGAAGSAFSPSSTTSESSTSSASHDVIRETAKRHPGLRIGRTGLVFESLVPAVLEQKVVGREAWRAWRWLLRKYGETAPGPAPEGMRVMPAAEVWRRIPSWDWHRAGAEAVRARTIVNAARHAGKLEAAASSGEADRLLRALPGIGVWTSAEIRQRAYGDADAVSVGDYHIPALVGWALTGAKTDDAGMLRLLAPYRGHRHRVVRLVELSGRRPPARGPRMAARDYRAF